MTCSPQQGHTDYHRPDERHARAVGQVPVGTGRTLPGPWPSPRSVGELSRPEGQPEFLGTSGTTRRHGKSYRCQPSGFQQDRAGIQPIRAQLSHQHLSWNVRFREEDGFRGRCCRQPGSQCVLLSRFGTQTTA